MNRADFEGPPCECPECRQAGVTDKPQIRDYHTGKWMHGYALKGWYAAKENFEKSAAAFKVKGF